MPSKPVPFRKPSKSFKPETIEQTRRVLDWFVKQEGNLRKSAVDVAAREIGRRPETVKDYVKAAAYASTHSPESPLSMTQVPRTLRPTVQRLLAATEKGEIDASLVRRAGDAFLRQTVSANTQRFDEVFKVTNPETLEFRRRFAENADKIGEILQKAHDAHPVRAIAGRKIHSEKTWVVRNVPSESIPKAMNSLYRYNLIKSHSELEYARARAGILRFTRARNLAELKASSPGLARHLSSLRKTVQHWNTSPSSPWRKIPKEAEDAFIAEWRAASLRLKREQPVLERLPAVDRFILETGKALDEARTLYHAAERFREGDPLIKGLPKRVVGRRPE